MSGKDVEGRTCPECGAQVVERKNKKTQVAFWGCKAYPDCDWTMPIPAHVFMERAGVPRLPGFED